MGGSNAGPLLRYAFCAPKLSPRVPMDAHENGYQHGLALDRDPNPHTFGSPEHEKYALGYAQGAQERGVPMPGMRLLPSMPPRMLYSWEVDMLREDLRVALSIEIL
jgi:hypothetical protein